MEGNFETPRRLPGRRLRNVLAALAGSALFLTVTAPGVAADGILSDSGLAIVATQNMDEGTDFAPLLGATSQDAFLAAVHSTWLEVQASNIPERAAQVAKEIAVIHPDLVGLQEVSQWRTGPLFGGPATTVRFDALQSLLDALAQRGAHYAAIATATESTFQAPDVFSGVDVAVTDFDVILARTDLASDLSTTNVQTHHFSTLLTLTTLFGNFTVARGWAQADVTLRGRAFRVITTHLEATVPAIRDAQAAELVTGPARTTLPVLLPGDFNSAAAGGPDTSSGYDLLIAAGFADVWNATNPGNSGFTWPLHLEDPYTPTATPTERIDLILTKGAWNPLLSARFGNSPLFQTPTGLWPSDHAGVAAVLIVRASD